MLFSWLPSATNLPLINSGALCRTPTPSFVPSVGYLHMTRRNPRGYVITLCSALYITISLPTAFCPQTNEEHRQLSEEYCQLSTTTACKNFVKSHVSRYTQLSRLLYFSLTEQIVIDPMHNLFLGMWSFPYAIAMC
jgi:hypothetical protein